MVRFWKLLTANDWGEQVKYWALFHFHERLSAKNKGYEEWMGLTFWRMNPQCLFIGNADTWFIALQLLADTNNFIHIILIRPQRYFFFFKQPRKNARKRSQMGCFCHVSDPFRAIPCRKTALFRSLFSGPFHEHRLMWRWTYVHWVGNIGSWGNEHRFIFHVISDTQIWTPSWKK